MTLEANVSPRRANFRHVVFAGPSQSSGQPLNFGPDLAKRSPENRDLLAPLELAFIEWLFERASLSADCYRRQTLARRLPACLRLLHASTLHEARLILEVNPMLVHEAISTLVIGVTRFFRDRVVFQFMRDTVIPLLVASNRPLRIWSVGCSNGRELYSVLMLLAEIGWLNRTFALGTDCRLEALRTAAAGIYEEDEVHNLPIEMIDRFAMRDSRGWRIDARLRQAAQWRTGDALKVVEPGEWDLILCRNLAIYLEPRSVSRLWDQLHSALRPGGILVVGKAERPAVEGLEPMAPCVYRYTNG